jgi:hypothetical protein
MTYTRVLPRDLFNEAKLLKELGFLSLAIHDGKHACGRILEVIHDGKPFDICRSDSGDLYVANLAICSQKTGEKIHVFTMCNSREENALSFEFSYKEIEISGSVFDGKNFSEDFLEVLLILSLS